MVLTCSTCCVSGADIGAEGVVTSLGAQAVVVTGHALVDVLALAPGLPEARWTRVVFSECLRGLTCVATLGVDTHVAVGTRGRVLMTLVDVDTRDQEELIPGRTLVSTARLRVLLAYIGPDCVHTNTPQLAIKKILIFTLEKKRHF